MSLVFDTLSETNQELNLRCQAVNRKVQEAKQAPPKVEKPVEVKQSDEPAKDMTVEDLQQELLNCQLKMSKTHSTVMTDTISAFPDFDAHLRNIYLAHTDALTLELAGFIEGLN